MGKILHSGQKTNYSISDPCTTDSGPKAIDWKVDQTLRISEIAEENAHTCPEPKATDQGNSVEIPRLLKIYVNFLYAPQKCFTF